MTLDEGQSGCHAASTMPEDPPRPRRKRLLGSLVLSLLSAWSTLKDSLRIGHTPDARPETNQVEVSPRDPCRVFWYSSGEDLSPYTHPSGHHGCLRHRGHKEPHTCRRCNAQLDPHRKDVIVFGADAPARPKPSL